MDRRGFLLTSLAGAFSAPVAAEAQQAAGVSRLAVLNSVPGRTHITKALEDELGKLGYVEGRNLTIDWYLGGDLPERAAELVRLRPDVILAISIPAVLAAKRTTTTIPIVGLIVGDAVAAGLVDSLARPGGNVTGVSTEVTPEVAAKQLEILKEVAPKIRYVAVLLNPVWQPNTRRWTETQRAAQRLGLTLMRVEIQRSDDTQPAFRSVQRERAEALFIFGDPLLFILQREIAELAARHHLPSMSQYREATDAGGLISYGPNFETGARRSATYVSRILKGAKPAGLPIEQPTAFELVINLKTAKALGLTIPPSLLARADQVIE